MLVLKKYNPHKKIKNEYLLVIFLDFLSEVFSN